MILHLQSSACYYDVTNALNLDRNHEEALSYKIALEENAASLKDSAVKLTLLSRNREAVQKLNLAIQANPSVAEFHVLR